MPFSTMPLLHTRPSRARYSNLIRYSTFMKEFQRSEWKQFREMFDGLPALVDTVRVKGEEVVMAVGWTWNSG